MGFLPKRLRVHLRRTWSTSFTSVSGPQTRVPPLQQTPDFFPGYSRVLVRLVEEEGYLPVFRRGWFLLYLAALTVCWDSMRAPSPGHR